MQLLGKFHSHLTIKSDDLDVLKKAATIAKGKLTVIDLDAHGTQGRECMITNHFVRMRSRAPSCFVTK